MNKHKHTSFSSKIGLIMAAAGSAVGLGNIWKFPYMAGQNGGGAFLIVYLICVLAFGLPIVMTEFSIGKRSGQRVYGAFRELIGNNRWQWLSWLCMFTAFILMGFYFMVTGWCFSYLAEAITNNFVGMDTETLTAHCGSVFSNTPRMILFSLLPILITASVLWFDVNKGIERLCKILMPLLLFMMLLMVGRVLTLEGSEAGLKFFFQTDFSKITPQVVLMAMGQCFFSLSIGMGTLITYGAYMPKQQDVTTTSIQVITLDTMVALLAGIIIFPAVFAFGFDPAEGPQLVFVVLPAIFGQMSLSWFSSVLFFSLLCIAAITSTISMMEVAVGFIHDATADTNRPLNRQHSVLVSTVIVTILVVLCILSTTGKAEWLSIGKMNLFDIFDKISSCFMMPLGALGIALFFGWFLPKQSENKLPYVEESLKSPLNRIYLVAIRWIVPIAIIIIFLNSIGIL